MSFLYPQIALVIFLFYAGIEGFEEYGLYTLLRIFTFLICGFLAYQNHQSENPKWIWIFGIIAIIFNPIIKIKFDRDTWETVDIFVASLLLFYTFLQYKKTKKRTAIPTLEETIIDLFKRDAESISKGIIPEKNLTPFDDIKREIVLLGYHRDFHSLPLEIQKANKAHFDEQIYNIKRLNVDELEKILSLRKTSHNDLAGLEIEVRYNRPLYRIVPPLFMSYRTENENF